MSDVPKLNKDFIIQRQGKDFVLYAGLLDLAHQRGLKSIMTSLVQAPNPQNENTAICHASVMMEDGRVFQGIGDASPANVGRNIAPHVTRMAETRSKARALRDAVNIGMTALEELSDDEGVAPNAPVAQAAQQYQGRQRSGANDEAATEGQVKYLYRLIGSRKEEFIEKHGKPEDLTKREAGKWIDRLSNKGAG